MPSYFSIWSTPTVVLVVDHGNFNIIRGNYHHLDRSTTFINPDPFNVNFGSTATRQTSLSTTTLDFQVPPNPSVAEPAVNRQPSLPTKPLAPNFSGPVPPSPNPSVEPPDHDTVTDKSSSPEVEAPYQPVDEAVLAQSTMETSSRDDEDSSPLHQSSTEASEPQLPLSESPHQTNRFKSFRRKIKHRLKRALDNFRAQNG